LLHTVGPSDRLAKVFAIWAVAPGPIISGQCEGYPGKAGDGRAGDLNRYPRHWRWNPSSARRAPRRRSARCWRRRAHNCLSAEIDGLTATSFSRLSEAKSAARPATDTRACDLVHMRPSVARSLLAATPKCITCQPASEALPGALAPLSLDIAACPVAGLPSEPRASSAAKLSSVSSWESRSHLNDRIMALSSV
jgi:hypothetical protein